MTRLVARLLAALLALTLLPAAGAAAQQPDAPSGSDRGPEARETSSLRDPAAPPAGRFATPLQRNEIAQSRADGCPLASYPDDPDDASVEIGVVPYDEIAPRLCAARASDRVTLEVAGTSVQGRELPLVTLTSAETAEQTARNDALEALLVDDPQAAAELLADGGYDGYKPTLMANGNIHGNEWEGTDYLLDLVDHLAGAPADAPVVENTSGMSAAEIAALPSVGALLDRFRVVLLPTSNPDGRVMGTRQNDTSIDLNRDYVTQSQPEVRAVRDVLIDSQPLVFQDHHGYVNGTGTSSFYTGYGLIEPATHPHGEAYEYDLYISSALGLAEQAEADILRRRDAGDIELMLPQRQKGVTIPFRDLDEGWDDWPPIFTPMYSIYHGAVGATVEFPFDPRGTMPALQRQRSVANNIEFGRATIDTMLVFGSANRDDLLADQLETYRRGAAGEGSPNGQIPDGFVPGWNGDDRWPTQYPRAYVIPIGAGQQSDVAGARLAQHLIDNDIELRALTTAATTGGTTYPAGSYVVDMHQAKRGLAHVMLHEGTDISDRVDEMYDISGWSLSLLWGATVADVQDESVLGSTEPVDATRPVGGVAPGAALGYALHLTSQDEIRALTRLWAADVSLQRAADGTVLVPRSARSLLVALADELDVAFTRVTELPAERTTLPPLRIGSAVGTTVLGTSSLRLLDEVLGLDVTALDRDDVADPATDFSQFDVLLTAEGQLQWDSGSASQDLGEDGRAAVRAYLGDGGGLVSYGRSSALSLVEASGLVEGLDAQGSRTDANGVLAVQNDADSRVLPDRAESGASFGYPLAWFPEPGDAAVEQTLKADPLVSGHWLGERSGDSAGQPAAAGQPLTVSAELAEGGRLVAFGSEPLFRWHPKGLFDEVVDALLWTADLPATQAGLGSPRIAARSPQAAAAGRQTDDSCPPGRVPPLRFPDVPPGDTHAGTIACMDWWQVAQGYADGDYGPRDGVTRGQMASFIARAVTEGGGVLPDAPADSFADDDSSPHHLAIDRLAARDIVRGRADGSYGADAPVTRAQMASFLVRAYEHVTGVDLPLGGPYFSDVDGLFQQDDVHRAAAVGMTAGREGDRYDPQSITQRGQMATFLARLLDLLVEDGTATPPTK